LCAKDIESSIQNVDKISHLIQDAKKGDGDYLHAFAKDMADKYPNDFYGADISSQVQNLLVQADTDEVFCAQGSDNQGRDLASYEDIEAYIYNQIVNGKTLNATANTAPAAAPANEIAK